MERRSRTEYGDIQFYYLSDLIFTAVFTALVVCAIFYALSLMIINDNYKLTIANNEEARKFNALSLSERQTISRWAELEVDEETLLMKIEENPTSIKTAWFPTLCVFIAICITVASGATFYSYVQEQNGRYFLADLPFGTTYGWALFFAMFIAWPVLLISAIRMRLYFHPQHIAEKAEVVKQAEVELSDERAYTLAQSPQMRNYIVARQAYINYRVQGIAQAQQKLIEATEKQIAEVQQKIRNYGSQIQQAQRELGEAKANLNNLSKMKISAKATRAQAKTEWEILTEMRGVAKLTAHKGRGKKPDKIFILVKVRVPYHNQIYDFGDYQIMLCGSQYRCERVRSGIKLDHTSTRPSYNESSGFCFGSRRHTITEYLEQGKTIEAVTLMVDCLHSVNDGDEAFIPDCFRKVTTTERAKRRLKRQAKLKGGN